jgi:starch phosphorylase
MLGTIAQSRLLEVAEDEGFIAQMQRAAGQLEDYLKERTWFSKHHQKKSNKNATLTSRLSLV